MPHKFVRNDPFCLSYSSYPIQLGNTVEEIDFSALKNGCLENEDLESVMSGLFQDDEDNCIFEVKEGEKNKINNVIHKKKKKNTPSSKINNKNQSKKCELFISRSVIHQKMMKLKIFKNKDFLTQIK